MMIRAAVALLLLSSLASCHKDAPSGSGGASGTSPCAKMQAYPDLPEGMSPSKCDDELAKMEKRDPERRKCMVGCADESKTFAEFSSCRQRCKRNSHIIDVDDANKIPPGAICKSFEDLESVYEHPPDGGLPTCVTDLTKVHDTDPTRYACIAQCLNARDRDYKRAAACRDACR